MDGIRRGALSEERSNAYDEFGLRDVGSSLTRLPMSSATLSPMLLGESPLLCELRALNREYLDLMIAGAGNGGRSLQARSLPGEVIASLARLPNPSLDAIAATPYTLFDMAFSDRDNWRHLLASPIKKSRESDAPVDFCRTVLFFAWHALRIDAKFARFAFNVHTDLAHLFMQTRLGDVLRVASAAAECLTPRWAAHPHYWPDAIRCVASGDSLLLQAARLSGCQLITDGKS